MREGIGGIGSRDVDKSSEKHRKGWGEGEN